MKPKIILVVLALSALISCSESSYLLKEKLKTNNAWPYEVIGTFEVADAHQRGDTLDWASAIFVEKGSLQKVVVFVEGDIIKESKLDIETGGNFRVWLNPPIEKYGPKTYVVSKIK